VGVSATSHVNADANVLYTTPVCVFESSINIIYTLKSELEMTSTIADF